MKQIPIANKSIFNETRIAKIGTTTPNDVLRQMYEAIGLRKLKYNKETLMFNFLNSND